MSPFQEWSAVLSLLPLGAGAVTVTASPLIGWVFIAVAISLLVYAIVGRLREYRADRHDVEVALRRGRIHQMECELGYEPTRWTE